MAEGALICKQAASGIHYILFCCSIQSIFVVYTSPEHLVPAGLEKSLQLSTAVSEAGGGDRLLPLDTHAKSLQLGVKGVSLAATTSAENHAWCPQVPGAPCSWEQRLSAWQSLQMPPTLQTLLWTTPPCMSPASS